MTRLEFIRRVMTAHLAHLAYRRQMGRDCGMCVTITHVVDHLRYFACAKGNAASLHFQAISVCVDKEYDSYWLGSRYSKVAHMRRHWFLFKFMCSVLLSGEHKKWGQR